MGNGVAWNGTMWVAVGQGTNSIAYSSDGSTWTGVTNIFSTTGNNVSWNGSLWVAVGYGTNTLAHSSDGKTWTGRGKTIFSNSGYGVAWNKGIGDISMNTIHLNEYGPVLSNKLDIVNDKYFNQGFQQLSLTITAKKN